MNTSSSISRATSASSGSAPTEHQVRSVGIQWCARLGDNLNRELPSDLVKKFDIDITPAQVQAINWAFSNPALDRNGKIAGYSKSIMTQRAGSGPPEVTVNLDEISEEDLQNLGESNDQSIYISLILKENLNYPEHHFNTLTPSQKAKVKRAWGALEKDKPMPQELLALLEQPAATTQEPPQSSTSIDYAKFTAGDWDNLVMGDLKPKEQALAKAAWVAWKKK